MVMNTLKVNRLRMNKNIILFIIVNITVGTIMIGYGFWRIPDLDDGAKFIMSGFLAIAHTLIIAFLLEEIKEDKHDPTN